MESNSRGRILGLDAGERRIGVAISDPERSFALPLRSIECDRSQSEFSALETLIREESVAEVVVGLPLSMSGEDSSQTEKAREFAREMENRFHLPVHLNDERLSTREAQRMVADEPRGGRGGRRERRGGGSSSGADTDALAASIILQAYLDKLRFAGGSLG